MDQQRERIEADLRGLLDGQVRCDPLAVQLYAGDGSIYEIQPLGVVRPRHTADVAACVQYAAENDIALHARGAGSGLAGESLGPGLVIDFSYAMRRIVEADEQTVRVQPGVVHAQLNRFLHRRGRLFGPDPGNRTVTTMGSVLALDATGSHHLRYGSARRHVESMQLVLATGEVIEVNRHAIDTAQDSTPVGRLVSRLAELLRNHQGVLDASRPKTLVNRCGYQLHDVLSDNQLDLARTLVGSEGTLAMITEATVRTEPLPSAVGVVLLLFDRLEDAARAAELVRRSGASACDLMDRRLLSIARETDVRFDLLIPSRTEALLLVEYQCDDRSEVVHRVRETADRICHRERLAFESVTASEPEEVELYWQIPGRVAGLLYQLTGTTRPLPFIEDIAVPPDTLADFLVRVQNVLKRHQVTASLFAHAGHGEVHLRPFLDLADPTHVGKMHALALDVYEEALQIDGTISGEHGTGLSRSWFVRQQTGPLYELLAEVKRLFDPQGIFNPGHVVGDVPPLLTQNLRVVDTRGQTAAAQNGQLATAASKPIEYQLNWELPQIVYEARRCNGCARCRTQLPDARMCPIFRFAPAEEASPRAKANIVRAVLTGQLDVGLLTSDEMKQLADLCVNCHQCRLECPSQVDIPKLMIELKAQYVATNGLRLSDWLMTRLDVACAAASRFSRLTNWALTNRQMRWLLEKTIGIAQGRKLPRIASKSFLRRAHRRRLTRPTRRTGPKVLLFLDVYANWCDLQLAEALVAVLEHHEIAVYVDPRQQQAGMAMIASGAVERARKIARRNVANLAEAVRQGYHIVSTEPSAVLCIKHEYPNLVDDDDAQLVAENTSEACSYLWDLHQQGKLSLEMTPIDATVGYHFPCHQKAIGLGPAGENLLRLVPELNVQRVERGCSGMAGTFGMKRENYRSSLRAGWGLISAMRDSQLHFGTTECSACKIQMEQGTTKPTIHPIKLLALSYGLMPELKDLLTGRGQSLVVT